MIGSFLCVVLSPLHARLHRRALGSGATNAEEGKIPAGRTALINEILSLSDTAGLRASASAG